MFSSNNLPADQYNSELEADISRSFVVAAGIIPTDEQLQQQIRAKTMELLTSFNNTSSETSFFSVKSASEQVDIVSSWFKTQSTYIKMLNSLKAEILSLLKEEKVQQAAANTKAAAYRIIPKAKESNITLCQLMGEVTIFCAEASKDVGYVLGRTNVLLSDMQMLLRQFNIESFLRSWEADIEKLSKESEEAIKSRDQNLSKMSIESEVQNKKQKLEKTLLQATTIVLKEQNKMLNETIVDLNETMQRTMDESRIYDYGGSEVALEDPARSKSLTRTLANNSKTVNEQKKKVEKLDAEHRDSSEKAVTKRMQQWMSKKSIYSVKKLSDLQKSLTGIVTELTKLESLSQKSSKGTSNASFFSAEITESLGQSVLKQYSADIQTIKQLLHEVVTNSESNKTNELIVQCLISRSVETNKTPLQNLLIELKESDKYDDRFPQSFDIKEKYSFLANCYKMGWLLPQNSEMSAELNSQAAALTTVGRKTLTK